MYIYIERGLVPCTRQHLRAHAKSHPLSPPEQQQVVAPSQAVAALADPQRGDLRHCVVLAPKAPLARSGLLAGLAPKEAERAASTAAVRVFRAKATPAAAGGSGGGAAAHELEEVARLTGAALSAARSSAAQSSASTTALGTAGSGVAGTVPVPPGPRTARKAKRAVVPNMDADQPAASSFAVAAAAVAGAQVGGERAQAGDAAAPGGGGDGDSKYDYRPLAALFNEAAAMTKKRFECWVVVLRASRLKQAGRGDDCYVSVEVADRTLHPGHHANDRTATVMLFCDKDQGCVAAEEEDMGPVRHPRELVCPKARAHSIFPPIDVFTNAPP